MGYSGMSLRGRNNHGAGVPGQLNEEEPGPLLSDDEDSGRTP
jgi:hypothetical protein